MLAILLAVVAKSANDNSSISHASDLESLPPDQIVIRVFCSFLRTGIRFVLRSFPFGAALLPSSSFSAQPNVHFILADDLG